jgi:hypothetical protein
MMNRSRWDAPRPASRPTAAREKEMGPGDRTYWWCRRRAANGAPSMSAFDHLAHFPAEAKPKHSTAPRLACELRVDHLVRPCAERARSLATKQHIRPTIFCLTQLSHRCTHDSGKAAENCGVPKPPPICGAKNRCPSDGLLVLTGSTSVCWHSWRREAFPPAGRWKSRLCHDFLPGGLSKLPCHPRKVWCLKN